MSTAYKVCGELPPTALYLQLFVHGIKQSELEGVMVLYLSWSTSKKRICYNGNRVSVPTSEIGISLLMNVAAAPEDARNPYRRNCNALVKHPSQAILIGAFEDKHLRLFDLGTMRCEHSMIAHLDSVASLDFSPSGTTLISGGSQDY